MVTTSQEEMVHLRVKTNSSEARFRYLTDCHLYVGAPTSDYTLLLCFEHDNPPPEIHKSFVKAPAQREGAAYLLFIYFLCSKFCE